MPRPRPKSRSPELLVTGSLMLLLACEPPQRLEKAPPETLPADLLRRELTAGESHQFIAALVPGELLEVTVAQQGVDLELRILGPGGEELLVVDGLSGDRGIERALLAIETRGFHTVVLEPLAESADGTDELRTVHRAATESDRLPLDALTLYTSAGRASLAGSVGVAAEAYNRAAQLWQEAGDKAGESLAYHSLGKVRARQGDPASALDAYFAAAHAARAAGLSTVQADLSYGIGRLSRELDPAGAATAFAQAGALYAELGDHGRQARALNAAAGTLKTLGHLDAARRSYEQAFELARQIEDLRSQGTYLNNLGELYLRLGQLQLALDTFQESLELRHRASDRRGEGITLTGRGTAERRLGRLADSRESYLAA